MSWKITQGKKTQLQSRLGGVEMIEIGHNPVPNLALNLG